jgi:hypothetical protein
MKKIILSVVIVLMAVTTINAKETETRVFGDFSSVYFFGNIEVQMVKADSNYAILTAEGELKLNTVTTQLKKGKLIIKNTGIGDEKQLHIIFYYKSINSIAAKAGVELSSKDVFIAKDFKIRLSKGAEARIEVDLKSFDASVLQGSKLYVSGKVVDLKAYCNTGSVFSAYKLNCTNVDLKAITGSEIMVSVSKNLEANAHTGGSIYYKGSPKIVSQKANTGGTITKK